MSRIEPRNCIVRGAEGATPRAKVTYHTDRTAKDTLNESDANGLGELFRQIRKVRMSLTDLEVPNIRRATMLVTCKDSQSLPIPLP